MVTKGTFRAMLCLAMIFLSFNNSYRSLCFQSSYENLFSNRGESSELFIMFSTKGKVNIISAAYGGDGSPTPTPLCELDLSRPLVSTTINIKMIDFDELNILPGDDGRLYLIHSKSDTFKLINTTIPELVKQSPIASKYLPNVLFRGREKTKRYTIDLGKGSLDHFDESELSLSTSSSLSFSSSVFNHHSGQNKSSISFDRTDYILQSIINNSFIAWNATYSIINISSSISYEDYYPIYHKSDYLILKQYGDQYQYIFKYLPKTATVLLMSDQLKEDPTDKDSSKPHNKTDSYSYALCLIIVGIIVISILFAIGLSMKAKVANTKSQIIIIKQMIPYKRRTVDTGSDDSISQLSTGSRVPGMNNKTANVSKRRHSFSYKNVNCCCPTIIREQNQRIKKEDYYYEPFHRESAPEFSISLNNNNNNEGNNSNNNNNKDNNNNELIKNNSNDTMKQILSEESNEEELSPNKIYTMKKITTVLMDKPKSTPPFQLENIAEKTNILERRATLNHSNQGSDSFHNSKKKYLLSDEEKEKLKQLNTKYLQDIKKSSSSIICQIDQCETHSKKYSQLYRIINNSSSGNDGHKGNQTDEDNHLLEEMIQSTRFSQMCDTGRFITNFEDIQLIGKGGFGSVFKAMHKIDDCYYAIKVIKFSVGIEEDISKINEVQEIKTMMKVEHKNIVRYITCWFEFKDSTVLSNKKVRSLSMEEVPIVKKKSMRSKGFCLNGTTTNNLKSSNNQLSEFELVIRDNDNDISVQKSNNYEGIIFENEGKHSNGFDFKGNKDFDDNEDDNKDQADIIFGYSNEEDSDSHNNADSNEASADYSCPFEQTSNKNSDIIVIDKQKKKMTLTYPVYFYMQMEYCDGFPLSYYLEKRSTTLPEGLIVHIFRQIALAVQHIHNKKIIHRDLKPANIFIHGQFKVKIGDFGLAAEINQSHKEKVGTFLYQSPEQIEGKGYNEKVDIYALGLILLEMCLFFNTESERRITLMNIRKMIYPDELALLKELKTEISLAKKMTQKSQSIRPSIAEVINSKEMTEMIEKI